MHCQTERPRHVSGHNRRRAAPVKRKAKKGIGRRDMNAKYAQDPSNANPAVRALWPFDGARSITRLDRGRPNTEPDRMALCRVRDNR